MSRIRRVHVEPDDQAALDTAEWLVDVECCRVWQVSPMRPWGRCGLCGEKPEIKWGRP